MLHLHLNRCHKHVRVHLVMEIANFYVKHTFLASRSSRNRKVKKWRGDRLSIHVVLIFASKSPPSTLTTKLFNVELYLLYM